MGHAEIAWSAVCLVVLDSQLYKGEKPHQYIDE